MTATTRNKKNRGRKALIVREQFQAQNMFRAPKEAWEPFMKTGHFDLTMWKSAGGESFGVRTATPLIQLDERVFYELSKLLSIPFSSFASAFGQNVWENKGSITKRDSYYKAEAVLGDFNELVEAIYPNSYEQTKYRKQVLESIHRISSMQLTTMTVEGKMYTQKFRQIFTELEIVGNTRKDKTVPKKFKLKFNKELAPLLKHNGVAFIGGELLDNASPQTFSTTNFLLMKGEKMEEFTKTPFLAEEFEHYMYGISERVRQKEMAKFTKETGVEYELIDGIYYPKDS